MDLWPENEAAINLFLVLSSQWRMGPCGAIGLDYTPFFARMDRMRLTEEAYDQLFEDLRVIESEALVHINKKD